MQAFGVAFLLISAVGAIGYLLGRNPGSWSGLFPLPGDAQQPGAVPVGDGDAGQAAGQGTADIPLDGAYSPVAAAQGAHKAAQAAGGSFAPAVSPVTPGPGASFVPQWTNPDSSDVQVD